MNFRLLHVLPATVFFLGMCVGLADDSPRPITIVLLIAPDQFVGSEGSVNAIRSQLSDLPVQLEVEDLRGEDGDGASTHPSARAKDLIDSRDISAVIWLDREGAERLNFLLAKDGGTFVFERNLPNDDIAPVQTENLALILRATVYALLEQELGVPPPAPKEPEPSQPPSRPTQKPAPLKGSEENVQKPEREPITGLEVAYAYRAYSLAEPAVSGLHAGLHLRLGTIAYVSLAYEIRQPLTASGSCAKTTLRAHPITLGGRLLWRRGLVSFGPTLAFALDISTYDATTSCYRVAANEDQHRLNFSTAAGFLVAVRIYARMSVFLLAEVDVAWIAARYTAPSDTGGTDTLFDTWRVQPAATCGISVELF